jgi:Xaa-Pro aminopeptidase
MVVLTQAPPPAGSPASATTERPLLLGQPREDYAARRAELMRRVREASPNPDQTVIVFRGADPPEEDGRFRQTNDFAYLTGSEAPSGVLVLWPATEREVLYLPKPPAFAGVFSQARPGPGPETAAKLGIAAVEPTEKLLADLFGTIADPLVGFPARGQGIVYVRNPDPRRPAEGPEPKLVRLLRDGAPTTDFRDVRPITAAMRKVKSPAELDQIQRAIAVTGEALDRIAATIRPGISEGVLEGEALGAFLRGGAERPGFSTIVGSGPNGTIPHYFENSRRIEPGELVVVDLGAECQYYTADITRTFPVDGRFTPRQREIYQLVLDAQKAVEAEMKPGETKLGDMTRFTKEFLRNSPLRARDENGEEQTMDHFFVHGLGHYLGMDVHDVGSYSEPMQVGEVFTIEPGLYVKSESIGVRIEDDYVMTEDGPEKLSKGIPSEPDEVERMIAEARPQP